MYHLHDEIIDVALEKKYFQYDNGAVIVKFSEETNLPSLILRKRDGAVTYSMTDLSTIKERLNFFKAKRILYVVDKRQSLHFRQVFEASRITNISKNAKMRHIPFGTVNGKDGTPFKTREGNAMTLEKLIKIASDWSSKYFGKLVSKGISCQDMSKKIGLSMIKFSDLSNPTRNNYVFDIKKFSKCEGKSGPYLLYTAVRIDSLLKKCNTIKYEKCNLKVSSSMTPNEKDLCMSLIKFPIFLAKVYDQCEPFYLCNYAYQISNSFNRFYVGSSILSERDKIVKASRISLCHFTLKCLNVSLDLLGIDVPEFMWYEKNCIILNHSIFID